MWGARACRVCLAGAGAGAALLPAPRAARLLRAYEQAAGLPFQEECGMPRQLCYVCAALLIKFSMFRKKCRRSHFLLMAIYDAHDQITDEEIAKIDREASKLTSPYVIKKLEPLSFDPLPSIEVTIFKREDPHDSIGCVKKEEDIAAASSPLQDVPEIHDSDDASMKDEPLINYKRVKVKRDKDKEKKTKEVKAPKKERKKTLKKKETVSPEETVVAEESIVTEGDEKPPKKERKKAVEKYPQSFYEEFATITYLTREQQLEEVLKRQETSNYKNSPLKCTLCFKGFLEESTYNNHMVRHDLASGEFECDICRRRFKTSRVLKKHAASYHMRRYTCKWCQHVCANPCQARMHEKWHKGTSYKCPHCDDSFLKFTSYMGHLRKKHPSQFVCEMCGNAFVSEKGIMLHKKLAHRDELPPTQGPFCSECDVRFASDDAYKKHLLTSNKHNLTNDCLYECNECGQTFDQYRELRNHMYNDHGHAPRAPLSQKLRKPRASSSKQRRKPRTTPVDKNYPRKCDQCPVEVTSGRDYWMHFRQAHKDQHYPKQASKFTCEVCGRGFKGMALLGYHLRKHTGEKPFKCTLCEKSFMLAEYLTRHQRVHSGEKRYQCSVCDKRYRSKSNLDNHFLIHTGVKKHPCELCGKSFKMPYERRAHVEHVHLKKPWPKRDRTGRRGQRPQAGDEDYE